MGDAITFTIELMPFVERLRENEVRRAAKARKTKRKRVKSVPIAFPSVNDAYGFNRFTHRRFLRDEGVIYKEYVEECLSKYPLSESLLQWTRYDTMYVFFMTSDMLYKNDGSELAEHDVSNFIKLTEDAVFEWLMESDATVVGVHAYKRLTVNSPKVVIIFSESSEVEPVYCKCRMIEPCEIDQDEPVVQ